jgi:hypothetical protein
LGSQAKSLFQLSVFTGDPNSTLELPVFVGHDDPKSLAQQPDVVIVVSGTDVLHAVDVVARGVKGVGMDVKAAVAFVREDKVAFPCVVAKLLAEPPAVSDGARVDFAAKWVG